MRSCRFAGEPGGGPFVATLAHGRAERRGKSIAIDYDVLPSVVDPMLATKPGAAPWSGPEAP